MTREAILNHIDLQVFILSIFDNTFLGSLFAGLILGYIAFETYKKQKKVDLEFYFKKEKEIAKRTFINKIKAFRREAVPTLKSFLSQEKHTIDYIEVTMSELGEIEVLNNFQNIYDKHRDEINRAYEELCTHFEIESLSSHMATIQFCLMQMRLVSKTSNEGLKLTLKNIENETEAIIKHLEFKE